MKKRAIALLLVSVLTIGSISVTYGDEISDLQEEQANTQQQLADLNDSIDSIEVAKGVLIGQMNETDQQLVLTMATISTLNDQIDLKNQQLEKTSADLEEAQKEEQIEYNAMKKRIQYMYETGGENGWATVLFDENNITDMLNQAEYTQKIYEYDRNCLKQYTETVERVSGLKTELEREKTELEYMLINQQEQQAYLEEQLASMRETSADYDAQLAYTTQVAASYADLLNQQQAMIEELLAEQERQRQAAEAAAAAAAAAAEAAALAQSQAEAEAAAAAAAAAAQEYYEQTGQEYNPETGDDGSGGGGGGYTYEEAAYYSGGNSVCDRGLAWVGRAEYVWGGCSPGAFDCSGFVSYCLTGSYSRIGTAASFYYGLPQVSNPQPGDVCCSTHHCGIYLGDGQMVHASDYGIGVVVGSVRSDMIFVRY